MKIDVIVIGAGASGLMCAMEAGRRGRSVLVIDHSENICAKVVISGGGYCNFSNRNVQVENYVSGNPHFCTSALARFTSTDFTSLLERHGIAYQERDEGQLFCTRGSRDIVRMLKTGCEKAQVGFLVACAISEVRREGKFKVITNRGTYSCESLVVATGGLSMPKLGASNFGYSLARQFGLKVTPLHPALTPLRFGRRDAQVFGTLSGVSIKALVRFKDVGFHGNILFTHKGLSGPAILQISLYWDRKGSVTVDLLPDMDIHGILALKGSSRMLLSTLLDQHLPGRFVKLWCGIYSPPKPLNQYSTKELNSIAERLHSWQIQPSATEGFNKAEVTLGGVDTNELSSQTMESKKVPGLYFLGEVVDVTGHLGGYNLHWAWASAHAASQYV